MRIAPQGISGGSGSVPAASMTYSLPVLKRLASAFDCCVDVVQSPGIWPTFSIELMMRSV